MTSYHPDNLPRAADRLVEALSQHGVSTVFSLSGNQIMPVYDAFNDYDIHVVHTRHEGAAVFMAEAYASVADRIGVALVTAAPGFGNALGALYSAYMSEVPVLFLSGDSPLADAGKGPFQAFDQIAAASPFVKHSARLGFDSDPFQVIEQAIDRATRGIPGPVHIALPFDVLSSTDFSVNASSIEQAQVDNGVGGDEQLTESLLSFVSAAKKPLILAGPHLFRGGRSESRRKIEAILGAPIITLDSPRGMRDPALGALQTVLTASDCVVYLGKPIDFTTAMGDKSVVPAKNIGIVSSEYSALDYGRTVFGDRNLLALQISAVDLVDSLLSKSISSISGDLDFRTSWRDAVHRGLSHRCLAENGSSAIYSRKIVESIASVLKSKPDVILICDGGEFGQWAQGFISANTRLTNGPSGAIGASLPYAIGAKLARPEVDVIAIMGDGTSGFHLAEFETAARESAGITVLIGNDSRWNAEHHIQLQNYGAERAIGCLLGQGVRYDIAAEGLGCEGVLVDDPDTLPEILESCLDSPKPSCVNVLMPGAPAPQYTDFPLSLD